MPGKPRSDRDPNAAPLWVLLWLAIGATFWIAAIAYLAWLVTA